MLVENDLRSFPTSTDEVPLQHDEIIDDVFDGKRVGGGPRSDWRTPVTLVTPEIVQATGGGLAALLMGQTNYWCSPFRDGKQFRALSEAGGGPVWLGGYVSFADAMGTTSTKARHAINKLVSEGFITKGGRSPLFLTPTFSGWQLSYPNANELYVPFQCQPLGPDSTGIPAEDPDSTEVHLEEQFPDYHPLLQRSPVLSTPPPERRRAIWVTASFIKICEENFNAAIVLSNLNYWHRKNFEDKSMRSVKGISGWFWKTWKRHEVETGLSVKKLGNATDYLRQRGFVQLCRASTRNGSRLKVHVRLNMNTILDALNQLVYEDGRWV